MNESDEPSVLVLVQEPVIEVEDGSERISVRKRGRGGGGERRGGGRGGGREGLDGRRR